MYVSTIEQTFRMYCLRQTHSDLKIKEFGIYLLKARNKSLSAGVKPPLFQARMSDLTVEQVHPFLQNQIGERGITKIIHIQAY